MRTGKEDTKYDNLFCLWFIWNLFYIKMIGLYLLSAKPEKPFEERRKAYNKFNWPANILIMTGVGILVYQWYF